MQQFKFRLQKVLDIRVNEEEECKMEFKQIQNEKSVVEGRLNELRNNYNKYNCINMKENIVEKKIKQNYLNAINYTINETEIILVNKAREVEIKREELKQKQIQKKIVETLREKKLQSHNMEQNLIEQRNNDEFALYGYMRNIRERR